MSYTPCETCLLTGEAKDCSHVFPACTDEVHCIAAFAVPGDICPFCHRPKDLKTNASTGDS